MTDVQLQPLPQYPVAQAIKERRSIKNFKNKPVSLEVIEELLDIAVWAPNHKIREPWRFIAYVEDGRKTLIQLLKREAESNKMGKPMKRAKIEYLLAIPAYLLVIMPEDPRPKVWEEDFAAVSAMIQNFQLAAWERGLGVIWKTDDFIYSPQVRQAIGVQPGEKIVGMLQIGYPEAVPKAQQRTSAAERLTVISDANSMLTEEEFHIPLSGENLFMNLPSTSKAEAIQLAGEKLVELGYVGESYIESMHEKELTKSTYLGNGICTPHGSKQAKESVVQSGVAVLHFPEGIDYENGERVYLMIAIAAERMFHLDVLRQAATMFEDKVQVDKIMASDSKEDFLRKFEEIHRETRVL
ncbi:nitroreductase family protein [Paenibacillus pinistramenti]|uniref:nitroreductase family protein n=1 Tax=Paenibacillus pinistramenti TaxID=1768003 RepID=UPI001396B5DE